jgi:putative metalloprotease
MMKLQKWFLYLLFVLAGAWPVVSAADKSDEGWRSMIDADKLTRDEVIKKYTPLVKLADSFYSAAPGSAQARRLARLTQGFAPQGLHLDFRVWDRDDVNASMIGDRFIRVYRSLMEMMNDDEVRCIIAHEIGHAAHSHALKNERRTLRKEALRQILPEEDDDADAVAAKEILEALSSFSYSRLQEEVADEYALEHMKKRGFNPNACVTAMEKVARLSSGKYSWRDDHPSFGSRIEWMREHLDD